MSDILTENEMNFASIQEVEQHFKSGKFQSIPQQLSVGGVVYRYSDSTEFGWEEIISNKRKAMSAFHVHPNNENMAKFNQVVSSDPDDTQTHQKMIVMLWGATRQLQMVPAATRFITSHRKDQVGIRGIREGIDISYQENITIHNINDNQPFPCKIDTGADMCSLHAENISINGDEVTFSIGGKKYRMPIAGKQTVKQADSGVEERPTVKFNVELAGQTISDVECNLNDRSHMDSPMLVGKNLLSKADFTINTYGTDDGMSESLTQDDWDHIATLFEDVEVPELTESVVSDAEVESVIRMMLESNCSLRDVIYHIKQDSLKIVNEDITY